MPHRLPFAAALLLSACVINPPLFRATTAQTSPTATTASPAPPAPQSASAPAPTPPAPPAPKREVLPLVASKNPKSAATAAFGSKDTIHLAATLPMSVGEALAARGTCRKGSKIWLWFHATVNGAAPHADSRKSGFYTDLLDERAAETKSIGGWLIAKKRDRGPTMAYAFDKEVVPLLQAGDNKLELWAVATCSPQDVLADEVRVELARAELTIKR